MVGYLSAAVESQYPAGLLLILLQPGDVQAGSVVQTAVDAAHGYDAATDVMDQPGGPGTDASEALHHNLGRVGVQAQIDGDFLQQIGLAAAGGRLAAERAARLNRLSCHDGRSVAMQLPVGVHHPDHCLGVGTHVGSRYIPVGTDQVLDVLGVAPGQPVQLA